MEKKCEGCKELTENKHLGKINGVRLCKKCRIKIRKKHRGETIEITGIKPELNRLKQQIDKERGYARRAYEKKVGHKVREKNTHNYIPPAYRKEKGYTPEIKGSTFAKPKEKSNAYLLFEEKKSMLKMLMNRGLSFEEAKERIKQLVISQRLVREEYQSEKKSEKQIKNKQKELLEELWNY